MSSEVTIEGSWPSPITLRRGWASAKARRWNDETTDAFLRLERGGHDFLTAATESLAELADSAVLSPAMYARSTRMWLRSGYEEVARLGIMERPLSTRSEPARLPLIEDSSPVWDRLVEIDRAAFEGFWRMGADGLEEALHSTRRSTVLTVGEESVVGYAIVGSQWNVSYLQRVAVHPDRMGRGLGSELVAGAIAWGRSTGAHVMVLNVRATNHGARNVYTKHGFVDTAASLRVLRYGT